MTGNLNGPQKVNRPFPGKKTRGGGNRGTSTHSKRRRVPLAEGAWEPTGESAKGGTDLLPIPLEKDPATGEKTAARNPGVRSAMVTKSRPFAWTTSRPGLLLEGRKELTRNGISETAERPKPRALGET